MTKAMDNPGHTGFREWFLTGEFPQGEFLGGFQRKCSCYKKEPNVTLIWPLLNINVQYCNALRTVSL